MEREGPSASFGRRRQRVVAAMARMNGGRGIPETLRRSGLFFTGLPAWMRNRPGTRSAHAPCADLLLWRCPAGDAGPFTTNAVVTHPTAKKKNSFLSRRSTTHLRLDMLIMAKTAGGNTWFIAQLFPAHDGAANPQISIIERGGFLPAACGTDGRAGYRLEAGRRRDSSIPPLDLPPGETAPPRKISHFLRNYDASHDRRQSRLDNSLVDNCSGDAIGRTYKALFLRYAPIQLPVQRSSGELAHWR